MNKYLYDNIEFTQDEIQIAADDAKLSFDDYLLEHPEIELLDISGPGDPEKKKKKKKKLKKEELYTAPTTKTLDFLLSEYSDYEGVPDFDDPKYNTSDFSTRFEFEMQPVVSDTYSELNKDIELEQEIDADANESLSLIHI